MAERSNSRVRARISDVLLWVGAFVIALAVVALYVNANIFNSARFADHAVTVLEQEKIRDLIAADITDLVVNEVAEDAIAVKPLINTVSSSVIESTAFQRLFRSSVLRAHSSVVNGNADEAVLTIANVGILVSGGLRELLPEVGKQIPDDFEESLVEIAQLKSTDSLAKIAQLSHDLAWILSVLAVLLVGAAFVISRNRLRTIARLGLSMVVGGALIIATSVVARYVTIDAVSGSIDRGTGGIIWDAFMGGLQGAALLMIGLGLVVAVVADGALSGVTVQDRARNLIGAARPPESTWRRVAWSFAAVFVGLWMLFDPLNFAAFAIGVAGLFVIAIGIQELALLATPATELASGETAEQRRSARRRSIRVAAGLTFGALAIIAVVGALNAGRGLQAIGVLSDDRACNGDRALCERALNEVAVAATHNSMSVATNSNWLFPGQEESIGTQLSDGIHGLLIDVYSGFPGRRVYTNTDLSSPKARADMEAEFGVQFVAAADRIRKTISRPQGVKPELFLCHGFCELGATPLSDAMGDVRIYLEQNPREVVTITFEDYVPWQELAAALEKAGLSEYAYRGPWGPTWPTLGDMIESGGRLVLMTENARPSIPWMHNAFESMQETPYKFDNVAQLRAKSSCDEKRGSPSNTLFQINNWVDTAPAPRPGNAKRVNSHAFLYKRVKRCQQQRKLLANTIAVDFYKEGGLFEVVDQLNSER